MLKGILGTGETQVLSQLEWMSVVLDTRDLSLLKFKPDDAVSERILKRSRRQISEYFGWQIDQADQGRSDDREQRRRWVSRSAISDRFGRHRSQ